MATFEVWRGGRRFDAVIAGRIWPWIDRGAGSAEVAGVSRPLLDAAEDGLRGTAAPADPEQWRPDSETVTNRDAWLDQVPTSAVPPGYLRTSSASW